MTIDTQRYPNAMAILSAIMLIGCDSLSDTSSGRGGDTQPLRQDDQAAVTQPEPSPTPQLAPEPEIKVSSSNHFHHYNPRAWDGRGIAIVFCPDSPRYDSCDINGERMNLHSSQDKGRDVWTIFFHDTGTSGTITCKKGNSGKAFRVSGRRGLDFGGCA